MNVIGKNIQNGAGGNVRAVSAFNGIGMTPKRMQMVGGVLKHPDFRRFAVSFGTVFCFGAIAVGFLLKTESTDSVSRESIVKAADVKSLRPTAKNDNEAASVSVKNERDLPMQRLSSDDFRLASAPRSDKNEQATQISDPARGSSVPVSDQPSAAQIVNAGNTNGGSFTVGSFSVASSEQQSSAAPTSEAIGPQTNDLPGTTETPVEKPMLGKLPRGYTYEQLLYRTWYGWGAYNSAPQQGQN